MSMAYQAVQIFYWLVLSVWLGGLVFLAIAAPVIFRTIRRLDVRSGRHSDPSLDEEHTSIVAGEIVGMLLARLAQMQAICAGLLLVLMIAQVLLIDLTGPNLTAMMVRVAIWAALVAVLLYEWRIHYPRTWRLRERFLEETADPEAANAAREAFDREHRRSEQLFMLIIFLLIGMVMLSANITPAPAVHLPAAGLR